MLGQWTLSARHRFNSADLDFLSSILADGKQREHLEKLWNDPEMVHDILDLKEVLRGLLDSPATLRVSPSFYFYVLVRHAFLDSGLNDRDLAEYVSSVLVKRMTPCAGDPLHDLARGFTHASDFIAIISSAKGRMRFHLQMAAGNQFLALTGLFPDFIKGRSVKLGTPDVEFYESFARQAYRDAADNKWAPGGTSRHLLGTLSEAMPLARRSLNRLAEEFLFLGD